MRTADREHLLKMYSRPQPLVITEWEVLYSHSLVDTVPSYRLQLHLFPICVFPFLVIGLAELIPKMIKMVKMSKGIAVKNGWV